MPTIVIEPTGYRKFITSFRAALGGGAPFTASYKGNDFLFTVVQGQQAGWVRNLYLTAIRRGGVTKQLSESEQRYGQPGELSKEILENALQADYVGNFEGNRANFAVVLLCTAEAARSEVVYQKIQMMLSGRPKMNPESGDILRLAQMYGATQVASGVAQSGRFRPLRPVDYLAHERNLSADDPNRPLLRGIR